MARKTDLERVLGVRPDLEEKMQRLNLGRISDTKRAALVYKLDEKFGAGGLHRVRCAIGSGWPDDPVPDIDDNTVDKLNSVSNFRYLLLKHTVLTRSFNREGMAEFIKMIDEVDDGL